MWLKLQLPAKSGAFQFFDCEAVRVVVLPDDAFQTFLAQSHSDTCCRAISFCTGDAGGQTHKGVLILGEGNDDGVFSYDAGTRFAYLPGARVAMDAMLEQAVDNIIREGTENTSEGNWCCYFTELYQQMGLVVTANNGVGAMLLEKLAQRPEAADVIMTGDCFDICYYLDYCKNLKDTEDEDETLTPCQSASPPQPAYAAEYTQTEVIPKMFI